MTSPRRSRAASHYAEMMLRCWRGHFLCSAKTLRDAEGRMGPIADAYCNACQDWVGADTRENLETMRRASYEEDDWGLYEDGPD